MKGSPRTTRANSGSRAKTPVTPKAQRRPKPDQPRTIARVLWLLSIGLVAGEGTLRTFTGAAAQDRPHAAADAVEAARGALGDAITTFYSMPLTHLVLHGLIALGAVCIGIEYAWRAIAVAQQRRLLARTPTTYYQVRVPDMDRGKPAKASARGAISDALYRAIHEEVLPHATRGRRVRGAPWIALTFTGRPDEPIEQGFAIGAIDDQQRATIGLAMMSVLRGQTLGAKIEAITDPLALADDTCVVGEQIYTLAVPPHYPLRYLDDIDGSDLLNPVLDALRPKGSLRTELQVIVRPIHAWHINADWRGRAMANILLLTDKGDYTLDDDIKKMEAKLDAPAFQVWVRVLIIARADAAPTIIPTAASTIAKVMGQFAERTGSMRQSLIARPLRIHPATSSAARRAMTRQPLPVAPPPVIAPPLRGRAARPLTLCSLELGSLWHAAHGGMTVRKLANIEISAPPHAYIPDGYNAIHGGGGRLPDATPMNQRLILGYSRRADGTRGAVGPSLRDCTRVVHATTGMGGGKTQLAANIAQQLIASGFLLADGKGDDREGNLVKTVLTYIPRADEHRVLILDMLDPEWPFGLNPLARINIAELGGMDIAMAQLLSVFARLDPERWATSKGMQQVARNAAALVIEAQENPTFTHLYQCIMHAGYRETLLQRCTNPSVITYWSVQWPNLTESEKGSVSALVRRIDELLSTQITRALVSQSRPTFDLLDAIEQRAIILIPMAENALGNFADVIGMLIFQAIVRATLSRTGTVLDRIPFALIVDELQVFLGTGDTSDLKKALTQLRSNGIAAFYFHQLLAQLGDLEEFMLTNAANRVIFATNYPDSGTYAKMFSAYGITDADISEQNAQEHRYASLICDGQKTGLFSMETLPWPAPLIEELPTDAAPPPLLWQQVIPADTPSAKVDRMICDFVYAPADQHKAVIARLAAVEAGDWQMIRDRWDVIRAAQRAYILAHPHCIPDRAERQRWLSRLRVSPGYVMVHAEDMRIRTAIDPSAPVASPTPAARTKGAASEATAGSMMQTAAGESLGVVVGAEGLHPAAPIAISDTKTRKEVIVDEAKRHVTPDDDPFATLKH